MINISKETHPDLYSDYKKCVQFCKEIEHVDNKKKVNFHILWKEGLPFGRKQAISVKSFLATQNIDNKSLTLWSNKDLSRNKYLKSLIPYINLKYWNPLNEAIGTPLENQIDLLSLEDNQCWVDGDIFRALCLYKYGGVYCDADIVFLRDFGPLLEQEFAYTWGLEENSISGGIIHMHKEGKLATDVIFHIISQDNIRDLDKAELLIHIDRPSLRNMLRENNFWIEIQKDVVQQSLDMINGKNSAEWSNGIYYSIKNNNPDWTIFPCGFFNTEWQIPEEEMEKDKELRKFVTYPFKKTKYSNELYDGVFAWHWHSNWKARISKGSKWQILEELTEKKFKEKFI